MMHSLPAPFFPAAFFPTPFPFPSRGIPETFCPGMENEVTGPWPAKNGWEDNDANRGAESGPGDNGDCLPVCDSGRDGVAGDCNVGDNIDVAEAGNGEWGTTRDVEGRAPNPCADVSYKRNMPVWEENVLFSFFVISAA